MQRISVNRGLPLFLHYLAWFIGFFILLLIDRHFIAVVTKLKYSFIVLPSIWYGVLAPIVLGAYTFTAFVRKWTYKVCIPILICMSLPCLILALYVPVAFTLAAYNIHVRLPEWLPDSKDTDLISFAGGLALMKGFFSTNANSE